MYVHWNIRARSCNRCCSGKAVSITDRVSVDIDIQHAIRMCLTVICGLSGCTIFLHFISLMARFFKKVTEHKMCVVIFFTNFVVNSHHSKKNLARYDKKCILVFT